MLFSLLVSLSAAALANGSVMRRQGADSCQSIPSTGKADNTFNNGQPQLTSEPPDNAGTPPTCYNARDIDLPFGRLYHGNAKFFSAGQMNTPDSLSDEWYPKGSDSAKQSACGIPDNAFSISKVAIHPYFLKYADLSRFCEQDVCISFWKEDGSSDMMLKVTDICSTDPNDPTHCATPADIKMVRTKMQIMQGLSSQIQGSEYPDQIWWFFTKCWADGLAQPAYQGNNWFTTPALPNNLKWSQDQQHQQWQNNQNSYAAKGWPAYPNGAYNPQRDNTTSPPISDWAPGDATPAWQPVAGGQGFGSPNSNGPAAGSAGSTPSNSLAPNNSTGGAPPATSSLPPVAGTGSQGAGQVASKSGAQPAGDQSGNGGSTPATGSNSEEEQDDCDAEL